MPVLPKAFGNEFRAQDEKENQSCQDDSCESQEVFDVLEFGHAVTPKHAPLIGTASIRSLEYRRHDSWLSDGNHTWVCDDLSRSAPIRLKRPTRALLQ